MRDTCDPDDGDDMCFTPEHEPPCLLHQRMWDGRCTRCGNWPSVCGHNLTFKERMKSIRVDQSSLRA